MYRFIECLTQEHHYGLLVVAISICLTGSSLTTLIAMRIGVAQGMRKRFRAFLAALMGGATIWSTHFIAMLAYEPGFPHAYDPVITAITLLLAVIGLLATFTMLGRLQSPTSYYLCGLSFGLTVAVMHYLGMIAYKLPGQIIWNPAIVLLSIIIGSLFAIVAFHRILYPVTKYCWLGGAVLMVLAICSMHFTGMIAFTFELSPLYEVPVAIVSDTTLSLIIFGVTIVLFAIGYIGITLERSADNEARTKIDETATIDALTQLPNRLALSRELSSCAGLLALDNTLKVAVLTIDLDRFKEVNDLHGHANGDAVLAQVSRRFAALTADGEFVARSGGDEYVAVKKKFRRIEEVRAFATRLSSAFVEPIDLPDASIFIGGSIGVATSIDDGIDVNDLLQRSDLAMYRAKLNPDLKICFFDAEMGRVNRERLLLIHDLRQAIARNEFELVYQFQNEVTTRAASGFEVLLRWNHADRGRVSPAEFIPLAEETGLIRNIGLWVLRTACFEAASWDIPYSIAVNVAPQQLVQPSFLENLSDVLLESRLAPERLELEVTEASIIDDQEHTLKVMHKIKEMGIQIAMDDFGTGYSSLATLQAFPFDKIKIDRSFIQDVHLDEQRAAIVRATLLLGAALKVPILAEGVEIEEEMSFLNNERCRYVQGFLFGKPLSLLEVREFVRGAKNKDASQSG